MNCIEIVEKYLKDNNFDGLYNDDCFCEIGNLCPFDDRIISLCKPGYKVVPPGNESGECPFFICKNKTDKPWEAS